MVARVSQDGPVTTSPVVPSSIPHGRTARRLEWVHLPPMVRTAVERKLGEKVVDAVSMNSGYTPGFASVLTTAGGARIFVKAASTKAQRAAAESYREEARKLKALAGWAPAPKLKWVMEEHDWLLLGIEYVEARAPHRPWTEADLATASELLVHTAARLTPAPGAGWSTFAEDLADVPSCWDALGDLDHAEEAAALARRFAEVTAGDTLLHTDVRDDNLLLLPDGSALLCDWNFPVVGANWLDSLALLIGPRGDGLDVEAHLASHPLLGGVDPEAIDIVLALYTGFFLERSRQPVITALPWLREVQRWQGEVCRQWLAERRGWS